MSRVNSILVSAFVAVLIIAGNRSATAQYAVQVMSYNAGTGPASGYTNAAVALGEPERITGEEFSFPGVVSPFNPPFGKQEIVSVGEGGQLTLRLSNFAVAQPGPTKEIGIFEHMGITDAGSGRANASAQPFSMDSAIVEVSPDNVNWFSYGSVLGDVPTNGYTDLTDPYSSTAGNTKSDFQKPFEGGLSSFNGLAYSDPSQFDMLELLDGSGGGKWLDLSASGFAQIGYIRFSLPVGGIGDTHNVEVDAVAISHAAMGVATPEPTTLAGAASALIAALLGLPRRRSSVRQAK